MLDYSIYFKIDSETDINNLLYLNQALVKRINILKRQKMIPMAEVVPESIKILEGDKDGK